MSRDSRPLTFASNVHTDGSRAQAWRARLLAPLTVIAAVVALTGCAGGPASLGGGAEPRGAGAGPASAFEAAQLQRAQEQERQGQLADAAWSYEVLTVLRPDSSAYRDAQASLKRRIESGVDSHWTKAQAAQKKGDLDAAQRDYLAVLALQPEHAPAADALRALEKERNRRQYLGTPSRITLRRGAAAEPRAAAESRTTPAATSAKAQQDRMELEHIAMLSTQGEVDEAIALLERRSAQDRRDPSARRLLADLYVRKAERVAATDRSGAIGWLQKCLKLDARHARATALMRQYIDDTANGRSAAKAPGAGSTAAPQAATAGKAAPASASGGSAGAGATSGKPLPPATAAGVRNKP